MSTSPNLSQGLGYTLVMEAQGDALLVRASGVRTRATVTAMTLEVFEAARANGLSKTLVNVTELKGRLGIVDAYLIVTEVFETLRGKGLRRAAVVDERATPVREWFLEVVARNRGFNFRVFADPQAALDWLDT
jgi:hypothetical protein